MTAEEDEKMGREDGAKLATGRAATELNADAAVHCVPAFWLQLAFSVAVKFFR